MEDLTKRVEGRTFEFSFPLPGATKRKKNHPKPAGPGKARPPQTPNNQATGVGTPPKPDGHGRRLNSNGTPQETTPAKTGDTRQNRQEYERLRRQRPECQEAHRKAEQKRRQTAKELGKCRDCPAPAITGQTRCETCAKSHRQSRRHSDAEGRSQGSGNDRPGRP